MASSRHISTEAARHRAAAWPAVPTCIEAYFEVQRVQLQALLSWQESLATCGKDCWEQWAARYAGGVPFDG